MNYIKSRSFTLLEIVISMLILSLVTAGIVGLFISTHKFIIQAGRRLQALNYARQVAETLKVYVTADLGTTLTTGTPQGASVVWSGTNPTSAPLNFTNINTIIPGATCNYNVQNVGATGLRQVTITTTLPTE